MLTQDQIRELRHYQQESQMALRGVNQRDAMTRRILNQATRAEPADQVAVGALFLQLRATERGAAVMPNPA